MIYSTRAPVVPLTPAAHYHARQFWQRQSNPAKAKQVYLNTLAVWAVSRYLRQLGIACNRDSSASWDPVQQTLADVASLEIPGWGTLECRPVLPETDCCEIPSAASDFVCWCDPGGRRSELEHRYRNPVSRLRSTNFVCQPTCLPTHAETGFLGRLN